MTTWRPLTDAEFRTWPKARLRGALLAIAVATGLLSLALLVIFLIFGVSLVIYGTEAAIRMAFSDTGDRHVRIALISASPILVLMVGSVAVFTMTLLRASATPVIAAIGAILLFFMNIATTIAAQLVVLEGNVDFVWPVLLSAGPAWIGSFAATAGFVGYMLGGARPNAYFRRRVAVPGEAAHEGDVA